MSEPIDIERHAQFLQMIKESELLKGLEKEYDRSFQITVDNTNPRLYTITIEAKDSGQSVMTVADVAAFLQMSRPSVRRMTEERAQRRSHHPIPFVKLGGKMLRFSRPAIEEWWKLCVAQNGKSNTSALTLAKGKRKR